MRKVFIDIGGNIGQSIDEFYNQINNAKDWIIYSFEPVEYDKLVFICKKYENVFCIKAAVGNFDEKIKIYTPRSKRGQGCTQMLGKTTGKIMYNDYLEVDSINFVDWFNVNMQLDDFIIVKINIEGGEYELMKTLPQIMNRISGLYLKLHHNKFNGTQKSEMVNIYKGFKSNTKKFETVIIFDDTDKPYRFKEMMVSING